MENKKTRVHYLKQRLFESNKHYESRVNTALTTISDLDNSEITRLIISNRSVYVCYIIEETKVSSKIGFTSK